MIVWGIISCLTGVTHKYVYPASRPHRKTHQSSIIPSFTGALLTRFFLGFVEGIFIQHTCREPNVDDLSPSRFLPWYRTRLTSPYIYIHHFLPP